MITAKDTIIELHERQVWEQDEMFRLLDQSTFDVDQRIEIRHRIEYLEELPDNEYDALKSMLYHNQRDRITSGDPYNAGDIKRHLRNLK